LDIIDAGPGNDSVLGLIGDDTIDGGDGNDTLNGDNGRDTINGGAGDDTISGGNSLDILNGGDGDDFVRGGKADDTLDGAASYSTRVSATSAPIQHRERANKPSAFPNRAELGAASYSTRVSATSAPIQHRERANKPSAFPNRAELGAASYSTRVSATSAPIQHRERANKPSAFPNRAELGVARGIPPGGRSPVGPAKIPPKVIGTKPVDQCLTMLINPCREFGGEAALIDTVLYGVPILDVPRPVGSHDKVELKVLGVKDVAVSSERGLHIDVPVRELSAGPIPEVPYRMVVPGSMNHQYPVALPRRIW